MIAEKTWLKNGDKIVAPFTTIDCVVDAEQKPILEKIEEKANASNVSDYLGVDVSKKRNLWNPSEHSIRTIYGITSRASFIFDDVGTFTMSRNGTVDARVVWRKWNKSTGAWVGASSEPIPLSSTITIGTSEALVVWGSVDTSVATFTTILGDVMLVEGSSASSYVPYVRPLSEVRPHSNRNLLDNPFFSVNQRNWTSGECKNNFSVDRWKTANELNVTVSDGVTIENIKQYECFFFQKIENVLSNSTVTVSARINGAIKSSTFSLGASGTKTQNEYWYPNLYVRVEVGSSDTTIVFGFNKVGLYSIKAAKLELGDVSTLAYDVPPNYATELLKCQRYYQQYQVIGFTGWNNYYSTFPLPVEMRSPRSLTYSGSRVVANASIITVDEDMIKNNIHVDGNLVYFANNIANSVVSVHLWEVKISADL